MSTNIKPANANTKPANNKPANANNKPANNKPVGNVSNNNLNKLLSNLEANTANATNNKPANATNAKPANATNAKPANATNAKPANANTNAKKNDGVLDKITNLFGNNENNENNNNNIKKNNQPGIINKIGNTVGNTFDTIKETITGSENNKSGNKNTNKTQNTGILAALPAIPFISNSNKTSTNTGANVSRRNNNELMPEGESIISIIIKVVITVIILVGIYYLGKYLINRYQDAAVNSPYLLEGSKNGKHALVISQDPTSVNYIPIKKSEGRDGIQFTYGFWFLIDNFEYKKGEWKHMFHKGNSSSYPNRAPGVWVHPDRNSIRVYMNTLDNILEYADIDNIPVRKWVYMNVVVNNKNLDVYVNGYLKTRKELTSLPKQNDDDFWMSMFGGFEGYLSNVRYYAYAVDFNEMNTMIKDGPSANNCIDTGEVPPYLDDNWWFNFNL